MWYDSLRIDRSLLVVSDELLRVSGVEKELAGMLPTQGEKIGVLIGVFREKYRSFIGKNIKYIGD